eukprot:403358029
MKGFDMYGRPFNLTFKGESSMGFDVAFGALQDIDPKYAKVKAIHQTNIKIKNKTSGVISTSLIEQELEIVKCGENYFNYRDKNNTNYQDIRNLYCIKNKTILQIGGMKMSNRSEQIQLALVSCQDSTNQVCATESEISNYVKNVKHFS